jgi:hypothetical protein
MATYAATSPWATTQISNNTLQYFKIRSVPASDSDAEYTLEPQYTHRPDLLAYDIYGTPRLWWVFLQRNMDVLNDPIFDFVAGVTIRLPQKSALFTMLGL